jgi:hypothetical protein
MGEMLTKSETFGMDSIVESERVSSMRLPYVQVYFPAFLISLTRYNPASWPTALQTLEPELNTLQMCEGDESSMFAADLMLVRIGGASFETLMHFIASENYDVISERILMRILRFGMRVLGSRGRNNEHQKLKHDLSQLIDTPLLKTKEYIRTQTLAPIKTMSKAILQLRESYEQEHIDNESQEKHIEM